MADIGVRILSEMKNVEAVLARLPKPDALSHLSDLETAGVAALLHSFYNGIENILKQSCTEKKVRVADGPTWHRDLLNGAAKAGILSSGTKNELADYLAFRHFFGHGYAMDLDAERLRPLVKHAHRVYSSLKNEVSAAS